MVIKDQLVPGRYHMRRLDRQLKTQAEIEHVLRQGKFVVLALCQDNEPYVVTLSYGYSQKQNCLYMHCANEGTKLHFIKKNPQVCGTVILDQGYNTDKCEHEYESVVLRGELEVVNTFDEQQLAMGILLNHLEGNPQPIKERNLKSDAVYKTVTLLKLNISDITGKKGK